MKSFGDGRQVRRGKGQVWWAVWVLVCMAWVPSSAETLDTLIDRIQQAYERVPALTADFVQEATLVSINRHQTSAGRVYIEKPNTIRWEYAQPDVQTILYDGKALRIYTPKRQQVLVSPIDEDKRTHVALLFLAGVGNLRETFAFVPLPDGGEEGRQQVRLVPHSPQAGFVQLDIAVNSRDYLIERLVIHDSIGNLTEIRLSSLRVHPQLPPQTFELVLPPGTEVVTPPELLREK